MWATWGNTHSPNRCPHEHYLLISNIALSLSYKNALMRQLPCLAQHSPLNSSSETKLHQKSLPTPAAINSHLSHGIDSNPNSFFNLCISWYISYIIISFHIHTALVAAHHCQHGQKPNQYLLLEVQWQHVFHVLNSTLLIQFVVVYKKKTWLNIKQNTNRSHLFPKWSLHHTPFGSIILLEDERTFPRLPWHWLCPNIYTSLCT